jgi:rhodanese-related sulfurtransferase
MVIEEAFAVLCWQSGTLERHVGEWTVEYLAQEARLPLEGVMQRLQEIEQYAQNIEMRADELARLLKRNPEAVFLLDVREPWEFTIGHLPNSQLMARTDLAQIFEGLKELTVVTICHHGVRSLSAALYLREAGLPRVYSLEGGLDHWSLTQDASIPRY